MNKYKRVDDFDVNVSPYIYKSVKRIFDLENPKHKPATTSFKTTVKRTA